MITIWRAASQVIRRSVWVAGLARSQRFTQTVDGIRAYLSGGEQRECQPLLG